MMSLGETPWVDRNLRAAWPRIAREVPESWLPRWKNVPKSETSRHKKLSVEEFACGHYGCVMPTNEEGLVVKLTSDPSEARFVAAYLTLPKPDEGGIVEYKKIFELEGQEHKKRPLYVLWREEAYEVGLLQNLYAYGYSKHFETDEYELRSLREGSKLLIKFLNWAHDARENMIKLYKKHVQTLPENERQAAYERLLEQVWHSFENADMNQVASLHESHGALVRFSPLMRASLALRVCYGFAQEIANTNFVYHIGSVLSQYMDDGILLADVHLNNIGRDAEKRLTITDPGHAVGIHPRWVKWPEIQVI